jgi:hypothetical protein
MLRENFGNIMGISWEQQKPTLPKRNQRKKLGLLKCMLDHLIERAKKLPHLSLFFTILGLG